MLTVVSTARQTYAHNYLELLCERLPFTFLWGHFRSRCPADCPWGCKEKEWNRTPGWHPRESPYRLSSHYNSYHSAPGLSIIIANSAIPRQTPSTAPTVASPPLRARLPANRRSKNALQLLWPLVRMHDLKLRVHRRDSGLLHPFANLRHRVASARRYIASDIRMPPASSTQRRIASRERAPLVLMSDERGDAVGIRRR